MNRFLQLKPVVYLGNISSPLFLWHWPVLIFFLIQTENEKSGVLGGLFIAAFSLIASALTYKFVEEGFAKKKLFPLMNRRGTLRIAAFVCVLVLVLPTSVYAYIGMQQKNSKVSIDDINYPGARSLLSNFKYEGEKDVDVVPNSFNVKNDVPSVYENDLACIEDSRGLTVIKCEYGKDSSLKTIALVGGSYSAHWLPALQKIIEVREPQWKIVTFLKSSCPMSLGFEKPSTRNTCKEWNEKVLKELSRLKPDLVISTSTRTGYSNGAEELLPSYEKVWDELQKDDLKVLALRDIPRRRYNLSECVAKNGYDSQKCILKKSESLAKLDPTKAVEKYHPNVFFADMTPYLCPETYCKPVVGNVLVHRDHAHMTSTYSATLYPMLWEQINAAFERFNEK